MTYLVSITSQGQISIPAKIRKTLGLERFKKAFIAIKDSKILIEPAGDILSLKGIIARRAKGLPISQIRKEEKEAFQRALVEKYKKR